MAGKRKSAPGEIGARLGANQPVGTLLFVLFVPSADVDEVALAELRGFLHRMGRETNQGEVGIVVGDEYHGISEFDD